MRNVKNSAGKIDVPPLQRSAFGVRCSTFPSPSCPLSPGFTLIELMVVIAVIGILMAGVFRLLGAAGNSNKRAETVARLERVQNAISGFYAEYGFYPPVPQYGSPDPYRKEDTDGSTSPAPLNEANARRAAACQPVAFCYPNVQSLDQFIALRWKEERINSVNDALGGSDWSTVSDWSEIRIFQFGLMSFLLPRIELMGGKELADGQESQGTPRLNLFKSGQWAKNNEGSLRAQYDRENRAVARWLPNLEKCVAGGPRNLMGIDTCEKDTDITFVQHYNPKNDNVRYMLQSVSVRDGWGQALYYHSMPPYQSYRIWSAGPDGKTFPPWISPNGDGDQKTVTSWIKDDIARFDRSK